jgi:hypothetical protein
MQSAIRQIENPRSFFELEAALDNPEVFGKTP